MKNFLLLVHDDGGQEARLQAALDLTRALNGHLLCVDVTIMPVLASDFGDSSATGFLLAQEREQESDNRHRLEARLGHEEVSWDWSDATGALAPCITDAAGLADLIIVNRRLDLFPYPDMRAACGAILVKSGKPILAVPEESRGIDLFGRPMVAWDGSARAMAALQQAVPLLSMASEVEILEVDDGSIAASAEEAASYLSRHGIKALIRRDFVAAGDAAERILSVIRTNHAAYLVMGGFGHSRFVEALFGGVTRRMLGESPVPLFLAR